MRKLILLGLLAATVAPSVASAQSYGEARRSERQLREEKRDLRKAQKARDALRAVPAVELLARVRKAADPLRVARAGARREPSSIAAGRGTPP